ncbi:MAG: hypothetical protein GXY20_07325 [Clostridiales bacterium]|nr:hypothetical protein [Clostridiales bacterium]
MNRFFVTFISLSVSGTLLVAILFILKPIIKDRLSKTWQYYIWLVVIVRLLLPFSIEINVMNELFAGADTLNVIRTVPRMERTGELYVIPGDNAGAIQNYTNENARGNMSGDAGFDYRLITGNLWLVWVTIAGCLFTQKIILYRRRCKSIKNRASKVQEPHVLGAYKQICSEINLNRPPLLYQSELVYAPTLIGTLRPCIVLPGTDYSVSELKHIFLHETSHYKRHDMLYKWLVQIMVSIHWFNPAVYLLRNEIDSMCELACDEIVLQELNAAERRSYGDTLLAIINPERKCQKTPIMSMNDDKKLIKERLGAIMKYTKKSRLNIFMSVILAGLLLCGAVVAGATSTANTENDIVPENNIAENTTDQAEDKKDENNADSPADGEDNNIGYIVEDVEQGQKLLSTPDTEALSIDEAAAIGAEYLASIKDFNANGMTFVMSYIADGDNAYWLGDVFPQSALTATSQVNNLLFTNNSNEQEKQDAIVQHSFVLDAFTGECREYRGTLNGIENVTTFYKNYAVAEQDVWDNPGSYLETARSIGETHFDMSIKSVDLRGTGYIGMDISNDGTVIDEIPDYVVTSLIVTAENGKQICVRILAGTMDILSIHVVDELPTYVVGSENSWIPNV